MHNNSIQNIRYNAITRLSNSDISRTEASIEADILIKHLFNLEKKDVISNPNFEISEEKAKEFDKIIERRINEKIPVQYLTNTAYFMGYEFYVDKNVLIPRPETEILVEKTVNLIKENNLDKSGIKLIDVGTGSGCIACMLAKMTENIDIFACDIAEKTLEVAKLNAEKLCVKDKISFKKSYLLEAFSEKFNIIVSNPPYIPAKDRESLQMEVSLHEPYQALFAEDHEGIYFYRKIIDESVFKLESAGFVVFEIGLDQSNSVVDMFKKADFASINVIKDYSNIDRVVVAKHL